MESELWPQAVWIGFERAMVLARPGFGRLLACHGQRKMGAEEAHGLS